MHKDHRKVIELREVTRKIIDYHYEKYHLWYLDINNPCA